MLYQVLDKATTSPVGSVPSILPILIIYMIVFGLYFLPSIIALIKRNRRTKVILFNIFLGWTFVMWIISLVWACKKINKDDISSAMINSNLSPAEELKRYKDLLDSGVITQEEFDAKKRQLLGI